MKMWAGNRVHFILGQASVFRNRDERMNVGTLKMHI